MIKQVKHLEELMDATYAQLLWRLGNPSGGMDYFVDNNGGLDSNDGLSWDTSWKTIAVAIAASNTWIARTAANGGASGWAARNRIFYKADEETVDLVVFPTKCDVIGVGSDGQHPMAGIIGNHVPVNAYTACRWYNVRFVTFDAGIIAAHDSASSGTEYIGCKFDADAPAGVNHATIGISAVAHAYLKVKDSRFQGPFSLSYIKIGTGNASGLEIKGNEMFDSADEGIEIVSDATSTPGGIIRDNFIEATTVTIHDESNLFFIVNNRLVTAAACIDAACSGAIIANVDKSVGNYVVTTDSNAFWPVAVAAA